MKKLAFGLMRLPLLNPDDVSSVDIERVKGMADEFLKEGFTYFDTAAPYHNGASEIAFREAVAKRYPRDAYTITDKLSLFMLKSKEEIPGFFDKQFESLGVDYIDYYLLHALNANAFKQAEDWGAFEFVCQKKEEGKLKHIGFSFHDTADVLDEILTKHPEMEYVQLQINYLDWEDERIQSRKCYEVAKKHGKPVLVMEPVKGGTLANVPYKVSELFSEYDENMSPASWAVRFAASQEEVVMVLSGMSNEEQIRDNTSYMKDFKPLNDKENEIVKEAARILKYEIKIPCTACRYCTEDCPKKIAIPDYFSLYNKLKTGKREEREEAKAQYEELSQTYGKASDCIKCGKCEKHCPQHLQVRKELGDVAKAFE